MKALDHKLLRDLIALRFQSLTIALVVAAGVAAFVASMSTHDALKRARDRYYDQARFAEVFARVYRAPMTLARRIGELGQVAQFQVGLAHGARIELDGVEDLLSARLLSLPADDDLNRLSLRQGRWPQADTLEVLVGEAFAERRALKPGDTVRAILNGRAQTLTVAGLASSPEYVLGIAEGGMSDDRSFALIWMDARRLASAFAMTGSFNTVAVRLQPGASERSVIESLDHLLAPYGSRGAYSRAEQPSHRALSQEINEQRVFATVLPVIFLLVAVFILNVVLARLVGTQRDQIATLKALGYEDPRIAAHYLLVAALIAMLGCVTGLAIGIRLGEWMTQLFTGIFRFPDFQYDVAGWVLLLPCAAAISGALLAATLAVREVLNLSPAEAMQPATPSDYRVGAPMLGGTERTLSPLTRMVMRSITRRPVRAALTMLGISGAVAILIAGSWWRDAFDRLIDLHFSAAMPADVHLSFAMPLAPRALAELERLPGVLRAEMRYAAPVRLIAGRRSERTSVESLPTEPQLRRPIDRDGHAMALPVSGLMLSERLARTLALRVGNEVTVEFLEGRQRTVRLRVGAVVSEPMGRGAYLSEDEMRTASGDGQMGNLVSLKLSRTEEPALMAALRKLPSVTAVFVKRSLVEHFRSNTERNLLIFTGVLTLFASAIAAGVVYNSARIALAERRWELATLRVLGMSDNEVSLLLLGELAVQGLVALPIGCLAGYGIAHLLVAMMSTETFSIPVFILPRTYAWAILATIVTATLSAIAVRRRLARLDLVSVLKTRE